MRARSLLFFCLAACGPCGSNPAPESAPVATTETSETLRAEDRQSLYDADGNLLPSDTLIAGLALPRGLEERPVRGARRHVYRTDVPLAKVQAYFGPRLVTGHVDRLGDAAIFRRAVPRGVRGGIVYLDVGIHPIPRGGTRIEVVELAPPAPPTQNSPTPEELIRRFDEEQRRLD